MGGRRVALALGISFALAQPGGVRAQASDAYMDYDALTSAVRGLEGDLVGVTSIVTSNAGRDVWLLTVGSDEGRPLDQRPALLVVANIEANRVAGSHAALRFAERLVEGYGSDPELTELLDTRTIYVIPRANPHGAELVFTSSGVETPYKPFQGNTAAGGGLNARELGRASRWFGRTTPPFMLQELAHRNAMFALFHADHMPLLEWGDVDVERLGGNTWKVTATIENRRVIPTRRDAARMYRAGLPDRFTLTGATVQTGGLAVGELRDRIAVRDGDASTLLIEEGVPGFGDVTASWIVTGNGQVTLTYTSQKGGTHTTQVPLS